MQTSLLPDTYDRCILKYYNGFAEPNYYIVCDADDETIGYRLLSSKWQHVESMRCERAATAGERKLVPLLSSICWALGHQYDLNNTQCCLLLDRKTHTELQLDDFWTTKVEPLLWATWSRVHIAPVDQIHGLFRI